MSSEDIRAEYPQVKHVAFSSSKCTLYFATPGIKAHGTITPGWKGSADRAENHQSSPTDSPAHPTLLPHPCSCTWKTPGELYRNQELFFLSARPLCFFSTQEALRCHTHWQEQCFPLLPSAALEAGCFKLLTRGFPPKTLPWPHCCGSTEPGLLHKVIIQQNRESHSNNLLCCWKLLFHSQSNPSLPFDLKSAAPSLYIPALPAQFHTWLLLL